MTNPTDHKATWNSPSDRIEFPREARIGMALINRLVTAGAPEQKIIAMVAATASKMSPALARIFVTDAHRIGLISELGKEACFEILKDHLGSSTTTVITAH
jgi:hypothetical protein